MEQFTGAVFLKAKDGLLSAFLRPPKVPRHAGFPRGEHRGPRHREGARVSWQALGLLACVPQPDSPMDATLSTLAGLTLPVDATDVPSA